MQKRFQSMEEDFSHKKSEGLEKMRFEEITVRCYSGYKASETPRSFTYRGRDFAIVEVVDRWYEEGTGRSRLDYFKARTEGGETFIIRYNGLFDKWAIAAPPNRDETAPE
ncbi:MAG: hypothetical protein M0P57_04715 [Syntrophales bacterium]|nr:hypothetical protein [Syntrophales bacterium]MDY0043463.1 hypothetical protein [Syntrophales bacterium]